jgi:undecaprenyl diphosphate synthase
MNQEAAALELKKAILARGNLPRHIAVIMDGNGRWAKQHHRERVFGHRAGTKATLRIVRAAGELKIDYLTLYTFSSENWSRPRLEVRALMSLFVEMVREYVRELDENNVKLLVMGDTSLLPAATFNALQKGMEQTSKNTGLKLVLALSYGSRAEILHAVRQAGADIKAGRLDPAQLTDEKFRSYLYLPEVPDPELLIRTGDAMRLSNYMLWQIAYSELWFTPVLWPDFDAIHLYQAISNYQQRERRFGLTSEQVKS